MKVKAHRHIVRIGFHIILLFAAADCGLAGNVSSTTTHAIPGTTARDLCGSKIPVCHTNASCTNALGSYQCACLPGFSGNGHICDDVDECSNGLFSCYVNSDCVNTPGSYQCSCRAGFTKDGLRCTDIDESAGQLLACHANASCTNTLGSYHCSCLPGFSGNGSNGSICYDVDECGNGLFPCDINADCANTPGSYQCYCRAGFKKDGLRCTDVDECMKESLCSNRAACINTAGSYLCVCLLGYAGNGFHCDETESSSSSSKYVTAIAVPVAVVVIMVLGIGAGIVCIVLNHRRRMEELRVKTGCPYPDEHNFPSTAATSKDSDIYTSIDESTDYASSQDHKPTASVEDGPNYINIVTAPRNERKPEHCPDDHQYTVIRPQTRPKCPTPVEADVRLEEYEVINDKDIASCETHKLSENKNILCATRLMVECSSLLDSLHSEGHADMAGAAASSCTPELRAFEDDNLSTKLTTSDFHMHRDEQRPHYSPASQRTVTTVPETMDRLCTGSFIEPPSSDKPQPLTITILSVPEEFRN